MSAEQQSELNDADKVSNINRCQNINIKSVKIYLYKYEYKKVLKYMYINMNIKRC